MKEFGYIVVGAGTAGCVLAARLTADPGVSVLLLEAGSSARTRAMTVPNAWPENLGSDANWGDVTVGQADAGPVIYPRGRALGGSGAINAMAHLRGHRDVYDRWAASGAAGWAFADLLPYFRRSERAEGRDPVLRGSSGPVQVAPAADPHPVARAFVEALTEAGHPVSDDLSGRQQEGVAWVDLAIAGGQRASSADAYLRPVLHRPNLTVEADCLVTRLLVRRGRCTGVRYLRGGVVAEAQAGAEVIVCAGAVGTPQLLMLSGIGPAAHLREVGIDPVADLPGVGENLQDHPVVMTSWAVPAPLPASKYNNGEACAALHSGVADRPGQPPDLHLFTILLPVAPEGCEPPPHGYALVASVVAPDSRGRVRLAAAAPDAAPLIDPCFLRDGRDTGRLVAGLQLAREAAASGTFRRVCAGGAGTEVWPGPATRGSAALRDYVRHRVGSYYHPAGTCQMGDGTGAVVDAELRVRGVTGLRVADASVIPVIPNAHPNATVLAIAERAADLLSPVSGQAGRCLAQG